MPTSGRSNLYPKLKNLLKRFQTPSPKGFTLIELLVVTALIGILSTIVLANYNSFGGRQQVRDAAEHFKSDLRKYQNFAISGQKNPDQSGTSCIGELQSYEVNVNAAGDGYTVDINCGGNPPSEISSVTLPTGISASVGCVRFFPLNGGTDLCGVASPVTISFTGDAAYDVIVRDSGEISIPLP